MANALKGGKALVRAMVFLYVLSLVAAPIVLAQHQNASDLLYYYQRVRARRLATEEAQAGGVRPEFKPTESLNSLAERFQAAEDEKRLQELLGALPDPLDTFDAASFRYIPKLRRSGIQGLFENTKWAFMGTSSRSGLDTTRTTDLRSRLEHFYGPPTRTLVETGFADSLRKEDIIQFEYWFVLDDSVAITVIDVNGPWDRGIVLAADMRFRSELTTIKKHLLQQLVSSVDRKEYVDYYFNYDRNEWYLTGYDGQTFFDRRILKPDLTLGRPSTSLH